MEPRNVNAPCHLPWFWIILHFKNVLDFELHYSQEFSMYFAAYESWKRYKITLLILIRFSLTGSFWKWEEGKNERENFKLYFLVSHARLWYNIVIPPNSNKFSRRTCHGSKLTNSLGKRRNELSPCTWLGRAHWNHGKGCVSAGVKQKIFSQFILFST